jgi:putative membrane protein
MMMFKVQGWPVDAQEKSLSKAEVEFLNEAASGGMMEIQLATLAAKQATNTEVRDFAQKIAGDHSKMMERLTQLAAKKGVDIPQTMNSEHNRMFEHLSRLREADFDREYMRHMVEDHIKDIQSFKKAAEHAKDPDVKSFASSQLPTLENHLKTAKDVHGDVERKAKT